MSLATTIRAARRPLPPHDLEAAPFRRWAAAVVAEAQHARDDFWRAVHELSLAGQFHRDGGYGDHDAPYRFAHEVHAIAACNFLYHLNAHDSDRNRSVACVRWNIWTREEKAAWLQRRRYLLHGFIR